MIPSNCKSVSVRKKVNLKAKLSLHYNCHLEKVLFVQNGKLFKSQQEDMLMSVMGGFFLHHHVLWFIYYPLCFDSSVFKNVAVCLAENALRRVFVVHITLVCCSSCILLFCRLIFIYVCFLCVPDHTKPSVSTVWTFY